MTLRGDALNFSVGGSSIQCNIRKPTCGQELEPGFVMKGNDGDYRSWSTCIRLTVTLGSAGSFAVRRASGIDEGVVGTEMAFDYGYMIRHPSEEGDHLDLPLGGVGAREDRNVMVTVLTGVCLGHGGQLKRGPIIC